VTPSENPADWSDLQRLLEAGLKLPLDERPAWLAGLPPQHDLFREPLRRLLEVQAGIQTRPFIDAFTNGIECLTPPATVIVGDVVGPYRLLQQLGDGGMGSVWLAERADGTLKRRVALKLPRMVWARDLSARMARERDILGSLEHPNIARLYDAGVDQFGRPFLALENVEGERIDQYCDDQKLSVDSRIRLFLQVLDAVDYAHVNLVLHRDLKPGNVLVNQRGEVRLLDFGIAKLMGEDESPLPVDQNSRTLARAMTPRYASPEQVQHLRLTLASDVYSLGVMLYELLVGSSPLITQKGSRAEIETAILEGYLKTPSRARIDESIAVKRSTTPSRLSRSLRGDLDAVLLKALARNVADRYPSVDAFRADLIRWLDERPVLAKPPSRISAIRKFVVRNAVAVSIGSVATCAVIAATVIAIFQAQEARLESRRATATRDFLIGLFENANPELHGGRDVSVRQILLIGSDGLSKGLEKDPETAAEIALAIGNVWAQLGDYDEQMKLASRRSQILSKQGDFALYASALLAEAQVASRFDDLPSVLNVLERLKTPESVASLPASLQSDYHWLRAWVAQSFGRFDESEKSFAVAQNYARRAKDLAREISALYGRTSVKLANGDWAQAMIFFKEAIQILDSGEISDGESIRRSLELHGALFDAGAYEAGWPTLKKLLKMVETTLGGVSRITSDVYILGVNWAIRVDELDVARELLVALQKYDFNKDSIKSTAFKPEFILANARFALANGDPSAAIKLISQAKKNSEYKNYFFSLDLILVEALIRSGKPREAIEFLSSESWQSAAYAHHHASVEERIFFFLFRGVALESVGDSRSAFVSLGEALRLSNDRFKEWHPITASIFYARLLSRFNSSPEDSGETFVVQDADRAIAVLRAAYPDESRIVIAASELYGEILKKKQKPDRKILMRVRAEAPFL
jgi:serine/threonine protein kinase/tetratricopeptide (TPR) repeat protein